ncbi:MAG TPA: hypothetical protein VMG10_33020 [Gemmataceae bacterium]|nr:hypothetical protein [Gemmataceae bacterium]
MVDLHYDPSSLCGPVDMHVVRFLEKYRGNNLDPSYLLHISRWHGGIPGKQYFDAEDGKTYRLGRLLTLVDEESELEPPFRPSWAFPNRDIRVDWSVLTLIDQEGPSCRHLFGGEELLPFAALYWGTRHPDGMSLTDGNVNLLGFLYERKEQRPRVVVWLALEAQQDYWRWEKALEACGWDKEEPVPYKDFTVPVAPNFDIFLTLLRAEP